MKILALDSSSKSGSIALMEDRRLIAEWTSGDVGTHSNWLLPSIKALLESVNTRPEEIDCFAIDVGPGSFTGLRIGISVVKGLAWPLGKKVIGVSTLASLAMGLRFSGAPVCPVLDARKGEVYAALYAFRGGAIETILPEAALTMDVLLTALRERCSGPVVFTGSGLEAYKDRIKSGFPEAAFAPHSYWHVRASSVGDLAFDSAGEAVSAQALVPVYLRKSEAEIKSGSAPR